MILTPLVREAFNYPPPKVKHSTTPLIFRASLCLGRPSRVVEERLTSWSFWMNPCSLCKGWSPPRYPKSTRCWIEDPPIQRSCLSDGRAAKRDPTTLAHHTNGSQPLGWASRVPRDLYMPNIMANKAWEQHNSRQIHIGVPTRSCI